MNDQDPTRAPSGDASPDDDPPPQTSSPWGPPTSGAPGAAHQPPSWPASDATEASGWAHPGQDQGAHQWPSPGFPQAGAAWGPPVQQGQPPWPADGAADGGGWADPGHRQGPPAWPPAGSPQAGPTWGAPPQGQPPWGPSVPPQPGGTWAPPGSPAPWWPHGQPGWGQQQPWGPGWPSGGQPAHASNGFATAGLVLGLVSIVLFWTFGFGVLLGLLAVVLGAVGMRRADQLPGKPNRGQGLAGVVTGVAGIVLGVSFVVVVVVGGDVGFEMNSDPPDGFCDEERFFQDPDC